MLEWNLMVNYFPHFSLKLKIKRKNCWCIFRADNNLLPKFGWNTVFMIHHVPDKLIIDALLQSPAINTCPTHSLTYVPLDIKVVGFLPLSSLTSHTPPLPKIIDLLVYHRSPVSLFNFSIIMYIHHHYHISKNLENWFKF